jgi:hypothetical protein
VLKTFNEHGHLPSFVTDSFDSNNGAHSSSSSLSAVRPRAGTTDSDGSVGLSFYDQRVLTRESINSDQNQSQGRIQSLHTRYRESLSANTSGSAVDTPRTGPCQINTKSIAPVKAQRAATQVQARLPPPKQRPSRPACVKPSAVKRAAPINKPPSPQQWAPDHATAMAAIQAKEQTRTKAQAHAAAYAKAKAIALVGAAITSQHYTNTYKMLTYNHNPHTIVALGKDSCASKASTKRRPQKNKSKVLGKRKDESNGEDAVKTNCAGAACQ